MEFYLLFFIIALAFVWFDTEAIPEYLSLLGFKFHKFKEWREAQKNGSPFDYHTYLLANHNNFLVRLVTCPYCVVVWFNLLTLPFIEFKTLGAQMVGSWFGYFLFKKLLRIFNE